MHSLTERSVTGELTPDVRVGLLVLKPEFLVDCGPDKSGLQKLCS
jgi:hypothetical protein